MDGVGIPIIERPRPLPGHDTPNPHPTPLHPQMRRALKRLNEAYPFDIKNRLFIGIAQKEPGTLLFLPCFSRAVGATLRFQPGHVVDAESPCLRRRPAAHSKRQCHECPTWRALVARLASLRYVQRGQPDRYDDAQGITTGRSCPVPVRQHAAHQTIYCIRIADLLAARYSS